MKKKTINYPQKNTRSKKKLRISWWNIINSTGVIIGLILSYYALSMQKNFNRLQQEQIFFQNPSRLVFTNIIEGRYQVLVKPLRPHVANMELVLRVYLQFKNSTDKLSYLLFTLSIDSLTTKPFFREKILNNDTSNIRFSLEDEFFKSTFTSNDSGTIKFDIPVTFRESNLSYLHIYLLYQNDLGGFYDTYLIQKVYIQQDTMKRFAKKLYNTSDSLISSIKNNYDMVKFQDRIIDYKSYSLDEMDRVKKFFDSMANIFEKHLKLDKK